MRKIIVLFVLLLLPSLVYAEPLEFRGIKMGNTRADVYNKLRIPDENGIKYFSERDAKFCIEMGICFATFHIKGVRVKTLFNFNVVQELELITFEFDPSKYETLKEALIEKYGDKFMSKDETVQNRMGAKFQNETISWELSDGLVSLSRYGSKIDKGFAYIGSRDYVDSLKERKEKQKKAPGF